MYTGCTIPSSYQAILGLKETEKAIRQIKEYFQTNLAFELNLMRVTAPLFVKAGTGINDDLNGIEKPVSFNMKMLNGHAAEIVQSLAKWKRMALTDLGFSPGEGLYTDMNAIRPDETLDNLHSLYVDQWDWEKVIAPEQRTVPFLKETVRAIYGVIQRTEKYICFEHDGLTSVLPAEITFIHSEELEAQYPDLAPAEREYEACKQHGAIFVIGIGGNLRNGTPHDGRAPDYDDWSTPTGSGYTGLNGDIVVYYPLLDCALELSSMGIRVDPDALRRQLKMAGAADREGLLFHRKLLNGHLPLTIGGGIGQSRLCMFYLRKAHIGEIQASIWPDEMIEHCRAGNSILL